MMMIVGGLHSTISTLTLSVIGKAIGFVFVMLGIVGMSTMSAEYVTRTTYAVTLHDAIDDRVKIMSNNKNLSKFFDELSFSINDTLEDMGLTVDEAQELISEVLDSQHLMRGALKVGLHDYTRKLSLTGKPKPKSESIPVSYVSYWND